MAIVVDEARWQLMEGRSMPRKGRLFADQLVPATDLNRRSGKILDMALKSPVTITRNDQSFALLRRDVAAELSALAHQVSVYTEVMHAIKSVVSDKELHEDHPYRWLHAFEDDDLALMSDELMEAVAEVVGGDDMEAVEGVIHEWYESAIAAHSEDLEEAFAADSEQVELTPPPNGRETIES